MATFIPSTAASEFYDGIISPQGGLYKPGPQVMLPPVSASPYAGMSASGGAVRPPVSAGSGSVQFPSDPNRLQPGTPVVSNPVQTFSPQQVAGMGTDLEGNSSAYVPLPRRRPQTNPAISAIASATGGYGVAGGGVGRARWGGTSPDFDFNSFGDDPLRNMPGSVEVNPGPRDLAMAKRNQVVKALAAQRSPAMPPWGQRNPNVMLFRQRYGLSPEKAYDAANIAAQMRAQQGMSTAPAGMRNPNIAGARGFGMNPAQAYDAVNAAAQQAALLRQANATGVAGAYQYQNGQRVGLAPQYQGMTPAQAYAAANGRPLESEPSGSLVGNASAGRGYVRLG